MRYQTGHQQLGLTFQATEQSLRFDLEKATGRPVNLILTDNSSSMLSARNLDGVFHVRLHRMFLSAGPEVVREIADFIRKKGARMPLFRAFLRDNSASINRKPPQNVALNTDGIHHDLKAYFDTINQEYFGGTVSAAITWGANSRRYRVRKRTLGSYSQTGNIIRISPLLDSKKVPAYFVAYVVYHEMLHAYVGIKNSSGRRLIHTSEFRRKEKAYRHYERAIEWERRYFV